MRLLLTAVLLMTSAALAADPKDKAPDAAPQGRAGAVFRAEAARANRPPPISHDQPRPGMPGRDLGRHERGRGSYYDGGFGFYPYPPLPYTWPYPGYPYSQYYYPYAAYPQGAYDDDDYSPPSTRGLVVPGNLPVGISASWYYCDTPDGYYPYVKSCAHGWTAIPIAPPPPGAATPLSYSDWQWCEETKAFFPYVSSCKAGFVAIPVTAPGKGEAGPPQVANWFFCDAPKGYSPYVVQCSHDWRAVPAVPPPSVKITVKDGK